MKKTIALLLALVMVVSMVACGTKTEAPAENTPAATEPTTPADTTEPADENTDNAAQPDETVEPAEGTGDATPAQALLAAFTAAVQAGEYSSMEELGNKMAEQGTVPLDLAAMAVQPGYLNGFTDEVTGFADGAMVAPWIGSIPFISYVFTLEDGTSAEDFINNLKTLADLRWNVCTEADEMAYAVENGVVCFVMAPASFEEE